MCECSISESVGEGTAENCITPRPVCCTLWQEWSLTAWFVSGQEIQKEAQKEDPAVNFSPKKEEQLLYRRAVAEYREVVFGTKTWMGEKRLIYDENDKCWLFLKQLTFFQFETYLYVSFSECQNLQALYMTFRNDLTETGWIHTVTVLKMCLKLFFPPFTTVTRMNVWFLDIRQNETSFSTFIKFIFSQ